MSVTGDESTVKEPNMSDNDQQMRTLFDAAADDVPPGIDLLRGFRARRAARRVRGRVALATAAASGMAAATAVTLTIVQAPSALAQLTSAVSRTAGLSYDFSATIDRVPQANGAAAQLARVSGAFDPAQRVGEETIGPSAQIRFIGQYVYLPARPVSRPALPGDKSWVRAPSPQLWVPVTADQGLRITAGISSVAETSPQNLFAMFKSASTVDRRGSASGPGWTGTSYAFSVRIMFGSAGSGLPTVTATGTVDVDQQGRVRSLDAAYTLPAQASTPAERVTAEMTFSDFGTPVSVSAPPASEVLTPANVRVQSGPA
jgi:hypothetical protein